jgi:UDP-3-O-[3-hydroxymyristoyl] glucosamine N-acyltransferase
MPTAELYRPTAAWLPTPAEVAAWTAGTLHAIADPNARLTGLGTIELAEESEIAFIANEKAARQAAQSRAGLLIVSAQTDAPELAARPRLVVDHVWSAVAIVMHRLYPDPEPDGAVHPTTIVGEDAVIGQDVTVGPYCVIGAGCKVGDGTVLGPHCIVAPGCAIGSDCCLVARVTLVGDVIVGNRVLIHPGAVLGADGFKFEPTPRGALKIPQVGAVVIEDDVEIGANTTIDRAFLYETRICRGAKIDNQCQIAHNVRVGPHSLMAAQVGIAGSTRIGAGCLLGGNVGLADNLTLGDRVTIGAASKVHGDHPDGATLMGYPAIPMREFARVAAAQQRLPDLLKRVRELEKKLADGENGKK